MPQRASGTGHTAVPAEHVLERIAGGLRLARSRTGLSEQQVVALLALQGLETTVATLRRWEATGLIHLDSATHLADAYGTTLDALAGRRAYTARSPLDDLPPAPRSSW
jgi:hypothetical protein